MNRLSHRRTTKAARAAVGMCAVALLTCGLLTGCHRDMWDTGKIKPFEKSTFPAFEGQSARPLVAGTVPYKSPALDTHLSTGMLNGELAGSLPAGMVLNRALLERGQERFNVFCSPCHGLLGHADGMVVKRGFPAPPSYHTDPRLLEAPLGHFVDVMTRGFGRMYSYATRVPMEDRWAIATYVRTLQLSQHAAPGLFEGRPEYTAVLDAARNATVTQPETEQEADEQQHR